MRREMKQEQDARAFEEQLKKVEDAVELRLRASEINEVHFFCSCVSNASISADLARPRGLQIMKRFITLHLNIQMALRRFCLFFFVFGGKDTLELAVKCQNISILTT